MVDIFQEVEEELRAEKVRKLAMRYGGLLVAIAIAIVAATAGWQAWRWRQTKQDMAAAGDYISAMTAEGSSSTTSGKDRSIAIAAFDRLAATAPDGYRVLARLNAAGLKAPGAAASTSAWDQVAADPAADPVLRGLATLLWAQHQIDEGDPAVISSRLRALGEPGMPWSSLVEEQLALLDLRQGKNDAARARLQRLEGDVTAPAGVRGRASSLISKLGE